ncbi:MAG: DUF305 domain-containing protein [Pseudonocardia sp.]
MKTSNLAVAVAAIAAALALTGCTPSERAVGNPEAPLTPNPTAPQLAADEHDTVHNDADVAFAQGMIPHHEQALAMTEGVEAKGASEQVVQLAETISQTQEAELAQLREMLSSWGVAATGMDHGSAQAAAAPMPGMLTAAQLQQLQQASGAEFDRLFLQLMIVHHEGAVQMAQTEVTSGLNPDAKALAQKIIDEQTAEIAQMRTLLG